MKLYIKTFSILVMAVVLAVSLCTPTYGEKIVWNFNSFMNPGHMGYETEMWLSKELEKRTNGQVKIEIFGGGALGFKGPRLLAIVGQGVVYSSEVWGSHVAGDLQIIELLALPGLIPFDVDLRKKIVKNVMYPYLEKVLREKFNIKLIYQVQVDPRNFYTNKAVRRLSDLKGIKLRTSGIVENEFTKILGAIPVSIPGPEMYTALQQGIVDGVWNNHTSTYAIRIYEQAKNNLELNIGGDSIFFLANLDKFKALPPEYQKILLELGQQGAELLNDRVGKEHKSTKEKLQNLGMTFYEPHPDDLQFIRREVPKIWDMWMKKAEPEAKEMMEKIKALIGEWEKSHK